MATLMDLDSVSCSVCLEIYSAPVQLPCSHVFCSGCLHSEHAIPEDLETRCPLCRINYNQDEVVLASDIEQQIRRSHGICDTCQKRMRLTNLKTHMSTCSSHGPTPKFSPVAPTSQPVPQNVPNRSTFSCPYCQEANLDVAGLRKHCLQKHTADSHINVVCPVCASMPWGDQNQISGNFINHVKLRHKFEYDTYVDYEQDDDDMLQAAIQASLKQA